MEMIAKQEGHKVQNNKTMTKQNPLQTKEAIRDMVIRRFLKWGELWGYLPISRDMGFVSKDLKGDVIPGIPLPGLHNIKSPMRVIYLFKTTYLDIFLLCALGLTCVDKCLCVFLPHQLYSCRSSSPIPYVSNRYPCHKTFLLLLKGLSNNIKMLSLVINSIIHY